MSIHRLQLSWQADTLFPRDRVSINPHFENTGGILTDTDVDQLCQDLVEAWQVYAPFTGEVRCKGYDAQSAPPNLPQGDHAVNAGLMGNFAWPREVALCLSYYSGQNTPTKRGRLYLPGGIVFSTNPGKQPSTSTMDKILAFGPILADLGGVDVDWVVYSRKLDTAFPVTNYYCDNEFDTVRSRGLRPTTRQSATASE